MHTLRSVVYVSTATHEFTTLELETLLASARSFNHEHGVTGVLLYSGPTFMQCFEGAPDDVQAVYDRIKRSARHKDIVEYMDGEIAKRTFGSWEMGLARSTLSEMVTLSTSEWSRSTRQPFSADSPVGLEMLKIFWSLRRDSPGDEAA